MIVDGHHNWQRALRQNTPIPALIFALGLAAQWLYTTFKQHWSLEMAPFTVVGAALSLYLAFRNNAVYDRYWEGRQLWGRLVNASRTLIGQVAQFTGGDAADPDRREWKHDFLRTQIGFVHALRCELRNQEPWNDVLPFLPNDTVVGLRQAANVPSAILTRMRGQVGAACWIDGFGQRAFDVTLTELATVQGGCERIKNTPLPPVYTHLAHRMVLGYCALLPFGLVHELGWFTPFVALAVSYTFLVLDRIGLLLEAPFGMRENDLPLSTLSRNIEIELRQAIGDCDVPEPLKPVDGILS